jgi:hypothetical protein
VVSSPRELSAKLAAEDDRLVIDPVCTKCGAPGVTRTPGTQFRKLLLYPPELRGHAHLRDARPILPRFVMTLC